MKENEYKNSINTDSIISAISSDKFSGLSNDMQKKVLNSIGGNDESDGGIMGRIFGSNKEIASMNIVFVICAILLFLCVVDIIFAIIQQRTAYTELTKNIIPIISLAIGYLLGKGKE